MAVPCCDYTVFAAVQCNYTSDLMILTISPVI